MTVLKSSRTWLWVLVALWLVIPAVGFGQQTTGHTTTWSKVDDLAGFETLEGGDLVWVAEGGNPGGFIKTVKTSTILPKPYLRSSLGAVFGTGEGTVSFDLKALGDYTVSGGRLFLSTGGQAFWCGYTAKKILGHDQTGADGWVRYSIPWKADWTEAQAKAQGWQPYNDKSTTWSAVTSNPVWSYLSVSGKGTGDEMVGIDNFRVEAGEALNAASRALIEPSSPQEKPVVHYAFDEGAGDVLHDRAGNAPDGKISGAKWVRNGERWALEFDGVDDFVNCGAVNVVGPKTLVAWIYAEPTYSVWLTVPILGSGSCQLSQRVYSLNARGVGFLPFRKWVHVAIAWDGKTAALYMDGTLASKVLSKEPVMGGGDFLLANPRTPLDNDPPSYDRRFKGKIASVMLYNRPLTHEDVLEDLRTSNITNSPMSMSIPQPGLGRIKVEVDAARLGKPLENVAVTVDILKADPASGQALLSATVQELDAVGRAVVDIGAPQLPKGEYVVRTTAKDAAGNVLGVAGEEPLSWSGSAKFPSGPQGAIRLNNLVTELLYVPGPDDSGAARTFVNPRTGFIFVSNRGAQEATITAEDGTVLKLPLSQDYDEAYETQRYLPKGRYTITTPIAVDLIVRAVAQTLYDYAHTTKTYVTKFGPYAGEFEERYVFPHYNTFLVHDYNIDKPFVKEWKAKGRRMLANFNVGLKPKEGQSEIDAAYERIVSAPGFTHPLFDGYLINEFAESNERLLVWTRALDKALSEPRFKGRVSHAYDYALFDLVTYRGGKAGREFVATLEKHDSTFLHETSRFAKCRRTELDAWRHLNNILVGEVMACDEIYPGFVNNMMVSMKAYVTAGPPWMCVALPNVDSRTWLEMQFHLIATHPALLGVRGLGVYRSPYADEETTRWAARLFRHYAIEGNTERLGKDPYVLTHIRNPEFEEESVGWDLKPAEDGAIRCGIFRNFGVIQGRYPQTSYGDTVLITKRSAKAPNVFSQEIKNLEPGRLYSFRMFSADRNDLSKKEKYAVTIKFDNATLIPEKCFTHLGRTYDRKKWMSWHVRVFRANGESGTLIVSDWASDKAPGGPVGQELMYNFIRVQPYWPE